MKGSSPKNKQSKQQLKNKNPDYPLSKAKERKQDNIEKLETYSFENLLVCF